MLLVVGVPATETAVLDQLIHSIVLLFPSEIRKNKKGGKMSDDKQKAGLI